MSVTTLESGKETLNAPAIVTRERLRTNDELQTRIARLGFGKITRVETPDDVLVITTTSGGDILAAGMLIKSPFLMRRPELSKPEIHVHTGVEEFVRADKEGQEYIHWGPTDEQSLLAASMTLHALYSIAHERGNWSIKEPDIGVPSEMPGGPIWALSQTLSIR